MVDTLHFFNWVEMSWVGRGGGGFMKRGHTTSGGRWIMPARGGGIPIGPKKRGTIYAKKQYRDIDVFFCVFSSFSVVVI